MQIAILSFFHYFTSMFKNRESIFEVEEGKFLSPKFDDNGLIPVTTTDSSSGDLLMHGYMNIEALKKTIEEMKLHEKEHCDFFETEIKKRNIRPTKFLPLWDLLGVSLGFGSTLLGKKAAMLCTASVEEVIDEHYLSQINQIGNDEKNLKNKIIKFRQDELDHKDIAYKKGATKKGPYSILDLMIKTGSKIAINISEKI